MSANQCRTQNQSRRQNRRSLQVPRRFDVSFLFGECIFLLSLWISYFNFNSSKRSTQFRHSLKPSPSQRSRPLLMGSQPHTTCTNTIWNFPKIHFVLKLCYWEVYSNLSYVVHGNENYFYFNLWSKVKYFRVMFFLNVTERAWNHERREVAGCYCCGYSPCSLPYGTEKVFY